MGLLKIARFQRAVTSPQPHIRCCLSPSHGAATPPSLPAADGASETRYSLESPSVRSAAEDAWGYKRHTPRRFGDALLLHHRRPDRAADHRPSPVVAHLFENSVHLLHSFRIGLPVRAADRRPIADLTARAVTPSVNPRPRRGYSHRLKCAAKRRR